MAAANQLPEGERNALLRRVDWRFLLAQEPQPASVSFASGRLDRAVRFVFAAARNETTPKSADVAVLANPRRTSLRAAWEALRPGGQLYVEWYLPAPGGPARLRRRLERAGFTDVRSYWPWPWRRRTPPQFWLPLDTPEALDFFLHARQQELPKSRGRSLLRALWRRGARLGLIVPLCAVARKPGAERREIEDAVREGWGAWRFGSTPERLSWLLLTGGRRSINKVVGLIFADAEPAPRVVVKFARTEADEPLLRREMATLQTLQATRPELRGIPRVLFVGQRCGRLSLGESAMAGIPLLNQLNSQTYPNLASLVTTWLVELAGVCRPTPREDWAAHLVDEPLSEFTRMFGPILLDTDLVRARDVLADLPGLPLVCEHRDCSPWNILLAGGRELALVDWESSEPHGLPGLDLVYFLTNAAFLVEGALGSRNTRAAYLRMLDPTTFVGRITRRCERAYCEGVGLDPELLNPLRLLCWTIHSRSEYQRFELDAAAQPDPKTIRDSFFLALWQEQLAAR